MLLYLRISGKVPEGTVNNNVPSAINQDGPLPRTPVLTGHEPKNRRAYAGTAAM